MIPVSSPPSVNPPSGRLVSLDALRGFDMFWILGADGLGRSLGALSHFAPVRALSEQLEHRDWAGFGFYDLIFPLFVFIVGVSLVFSLTPLLARESRSAAVKRILRRAALLFVLGIFYNGGLTAPWPDVRVVGVLQRIAVAYAATGLLFCFLRPRALAAVAAFILIGYWAVMTFVPIRDIQLNDSTLLARWPELARDEQGHASRDDVRRLFESMEPTQTARFEPGLNVADHLDFRVLPGRRYNRYYDPEGLLSSFPAIATCLLGVFAGLRLQRKDISNQKKWGALVVAGLVALAVGWMWHLQFPVIKKIWTSSFVLVAGGWSLLLLALFYYLVDVRQWQSWCRPFVWIGMNPITLYLLSAVVGFHEIAQRLVGGSVSNWLDQHAISGAGGITVTLVSLGLVLALARFLYVRKIFLRV
jgi:predicted acyltransferase